MTDHSERRRYPRIDLSLPIMYKVVGSHYSQLPANVQPYLMADSKNVSPIGVCLDLAEHLPSGAILTLSIHPPDSKESFSAMARVVWSQASETPGHYSTGLQFVVVEGDHVKAEGHTKIESLIRELETEEKKS
ncbi:MAG TPA: PilZ domain-containing protein [Elusimicrobiota bacterium]|nr:PilZ domain-containing protein [Elusimicrobiota bacterium]